MKILKRNQLIILVISLMLVTAGYLNFTNTNYTENSTNLIAELGDATLVSSNQVTNTQENIVENATQDYENIQEENIVENTEEPEQNELVPTVQEDTYFKTSKLERENIYSQMLETYQEIYNNTNSSSEQKQEAIGKIGEINRTRNAIMIAENLVIAKGFEDIVIFANENSVSVIIKAESLEPEQIAQIQNIVSRELGVGAEIINISVK